jgi:N-methylhydantoinase A
VRRVIVPRLAAVLSAWGMLACDLRCEIARTHISDASRLDAAKLRAVFREMEEEGRTRLRDASHAGPVRVQRSADMRYGEQIFEVNVALDGLDLDTSDLVLQMARAFHLRHEELYTYCLPDQEVVLVNARVAVVGELPGLPQEPSLPARPSAVLQGPRRVYLGQWREVPLYAHDELAPGQTIAGSAVIESPTTTILLRPADTARTTTHGWLDIAVG